jgi:hypothetical protein
MTVKRRPLVRKLFVVLFYWCLFTSGFLVQLCRSQHVCTLIPSPVPLASNIHARWVCVIAGYSPRSPLQRIRLFAVT